MKLINPDIAFDNFYDKKKYTIAKNFAGVITIVFLILCSLFWGDKTEIYIYYILAAIMMAFCFTFTLFSKNYKVVYYIISIGGTFLIIGSSNFGSHAIHYAGFMWSLLAILLAFFGANVILGRLLTLIHIISISIFIIFFLPENIEYLRQVNLTHNIGNVIELTSITFLTAYIINQFVVFSERSNIILKQSNSELSRKNEENTILVKEIHHRVKNNLQIVISLLRLQKGEMKSDEAKRHFNEAINRIMVMSLIHKKLYQEAEMAHIEVKPYIKDLSNDVIHISNLGMPIKFDIASEINKIGLKTIVPLGLLINELLSNSIKHAFVKIEEGIINIKVLESNNDDFILIYSDNGTWVEPPKDYTGFGLGLIQTLTEQLEGNFTRNKSEYTFTIKNLDN
ncbi:MAG: hypothetical protein COA97_01440 [Flavobacteriales bacterium]|nr:MAG: hypothetical protein COA97_01440 [Flavobacteriales bacterium]